MSNDRDNWLEILKANHGFRDFERWVDFAKRHRFTKVSAKRIDKCPDCNSKTVLVVGQYVYYSNLVKLVQCRHCKLIYSNLRIDPEIVQKHFEVVYKDEMYFLRTRKLIFDQIVNMVANCLPVNGRVIDIGGAKGHLLAAIRRRRPDAEFVLNDLSRSACEYAESMYLFDTICTSAANALNYGRQYDLVLMIDVLYYETNILELWKRLSRSVMCNGTVIIRIPNTISLIKANQRLMRLVRREGKLEMDTSIRYFNPEHIYLFSKEYLKRCLKELGFRSIYFLPSAMNIRYRKLNSVYQVYFYMARVLHFLSWGSIIGTPTVIVVARK